MCNQKDCPLYGGACSLELGENNQPFVLCKHRPEENSNKGSIGEQKSF